MCSEVSGVGSMRGVGGKAPQEEEPVLTRTLPGAAVGREREALGAQVGTARAGGRRVRSFQSEEAREPSAEGEGGVSWQGPDSAQRQGHGRHDGAAPEWKRAQRARTRRGAEPAGDQRG